MGGRVQPEAPVNLFRRGDDLADLLARIEAERYGVVIFDTLQRMSARADLNLPRDATLVIDALDQVRQATGGSAGYVAHTGKSGVDVRGASNLEDDADIVWRLEREDDVVTAELQKRKDGPSGLKVKLRGRPAAGTGSLYLESAHGFIALDTEPKRALPILQELDRRTADHGLSLTALAEAIGLKGKGGVTGPVDWLITKGFVRPEQSGRYPVYKITEAGGVRLAELRGK